MPLLNRTLLVKDLEKSMSERGHFAPTENEGAQQLQAWQLILLKKLGRHDIGRILSHHVTLILVRGQQLGAKRRVHSIGRTIVRMASGDRNARAEQSADARKRR